MRKGIFISHSSRDDAFAAALRAQLVTELSRLGYDAWLDDARLGPGDRWRAMIYRQLTNCRGAVLLLTPEALRSPWVRKEATILSFRGAIQDRLRLVPVLLGGVGREQVDAAFPALYLPEQQFYEVVDGQPVEEAAANIAASFHGLGAGVSDDMGRWTTRVRAMLSRAHPDLLALAAEHLAQDEEPDLDDHGELVAHMLLHGTTAGIYPALSELVGSGVDLKELIWQVTPGFVAEEAAGPVRAAMRARPAGVAVIGAKSPDTGSTFAHRASCHSTQMPIIEVGVVCTEDTVDLVAEQTRHAMARRFGEPPSKEWFEKQSVVPVIVLTVGAISRDRLREVVDRLRTDWEVSVLIVLTGHLTPRTAESLTEFRVSLPDTFEGQLLEHKATLASLAGPRWG